MYSYTYDKETGGILLNSSPQAFSKEPRPVYYKELDILGFNRYWKYDQNDTAPYMWAEGNNYFYKGRLVAQTKGGSPMIAPEIILFEEPERNGAPLSMVDIDTMIEKNNDLLEKLSQETIKKIYNIYHEYQNKVDLFYVAFSGGKDSVLVLDLVQRALPHNAFKVLFGDTRMEFSDTYTVVKRVEDMCKDMDIEFIRAQSILSPKETWKKFGPPAQKIRWCCSVHKTTPQILKLREILNKTDFRGMAFTGIRAEESASRAEYEDISFGEKVRGQFSCHPVLEWNSAELFLYIYAHKLILNEAYKKGNSRAGCLVCPLAGYKNMWFKEQSYSHNDNEEYTTTLYNKLIKETSSKSFPSREAEDEYINIAGWKARRSGRELNISQEVMSDLENNGILKVTIQSPKTDWREWMKTVGPYDIIDNNHFNIEWDGTLYSVAITYRGKSLEFEMKVGNTKSEIQLKKSFKIALRKTAYCIGCQVCEANCPHGFISIKNGSVHISDNCYKCRKCHDIDYGCLLANSNKLPKNINKMGSINRYANLGVEYDWVKQYFKNQDDFWTSHELGTNKVKNLRAFLNDASLMEKNKFSKFALIVDSIGIETPVAWALILCNLVYSAEFNWWVTHVEFNIVYTSDMLKELLVDENDTAKTHITSAFKNILISNQILSKEIGLGICDYNIKNDKRYLNSVKRTAWQNADAKVILYSLYKFAEACGDYYQFTLTRLMDTTVDSDGVSPIQIFGLDKDTMTSILKGLATNYPDYISVAFTLDLDNINLRHEKSSADVLGLF